MRPPLLDLARIRNPEYNPGMSRQMRIQYADALYHVTARGNNKQDIFLDDSDRYRFLEELSETVERFDLICYAYCLMSNHYHLMVQTPQGNLSEALHRLNSLYASYFNWKHEKAGHLFQGRFHAILVQRERYLLELCRYIVLNPVRARMVMNASDYRWSSYNDTCNLLSETVINKAALLSHFGEDRQTAMNRYMEFIAEGSGINSPLMDAKADLVLGDEDFVNSLRNRMVKPVVDHEIPASQRVLLRTPLRSIFGDCSGLIKEFRNKMILRACQDFGYSQIEVSDYLGISRRTVSRIMNSMTSGTENVP